MKAPLFSLPDQNNKIHSLADYKGKWVVLYFYPKDNTPGCIREACGFRDKLDLLQKNNIVVLGVSKDSVESHKKFVEQYQLNFPLLSDSDLNVIKAYKAYGIKEVVFKNFETVIRKTYIIGPDGEIKKEYPKIDVLEHAEEVL
ncbi:peroxiredoxin, partial [Candidatus Roizmanbacteria bacterium CG_4_10_14_0_8_um_filter_33_9]